MRLCVLLFCACLLGIAEHTRPSEATSRSQESGDEQTLWDLERAYWRYVEQMTWLPIQTYGTRIF